MMNRMKKALPVMRKNIKLSQSDLAKLSGVSRGVISNKLFDAFGISLEQLNEYFNVNK